MKTTGTMNIDNLDRAILEAVRSYIPGDDTPECAFATGFNAGVEWLMKQPWKERLRDYEYDIIKDKLNP